MGRPAKTKKPRDTPGASGLLALRVQPGASNNRLVGKLADEWKIAVSAPPVEGRANRACIDYLAKLTGAPRSAIRILRGEASRQKQVEIEGLSTDEIEKRLRAHFQGKHK